MEISVEYFDRKELLFRPLKNSKNVLGRSGGIPFGSNYLFFTPSYLKKDVLHKMQFQFKQDFDKYKKGNKVGKKMDLTFYDDGRIYVHIWKG